MKLITKSLYAVALGSLLFANSGCDKIKDFGDTNQNPNNTTEPSTAGLLTNVLAGISSWATSTRGALYTQYFSETQYTETSLYATPQLDFAGNYSGALFDLQNIINLNTSTPEAVSQFGSAANQIATARILKAYIYWNITDAWGDIPYSESLAGITPVYDTQEDVYAGLLSELTAAVTQFDGGASFRGDILYNGDNAKWKKLANTLRILIAERLSEVDPGTAAAELAAAYNDGAGYISSNADNFAIKYPGGTFNNPWWALYDGRQDFAVSETLMGILSANSDNRINAFGTSTVGFPYGLERGDAVAFSENNPTWARVLTQSRRSQSSPVYHITSAMVKLALAEARQRGWISTGPTAQQFYEDAIKDSWEQWEVFNQGDYNSYLTKPAVNFASGNQLQKIGLQRWLATFPNGLQGWFDWRRTGFPALTPTPEAVNDSGEIPVRYVYGQAEYNLNERNRKIAADRMGGDTQDTKVWWDQ